MPDRHKQRIAHSVLQLNTRQRSQNQRSTSRSYSPAPIASCPSN